MIKLTKEREITPYAWIHPDDDERRLWNFRNLGARENPFHQ
jgi:hypothetical protein